MGVQQLQDVAAVVLAEVECFEALACYWRACINSIIGELQILVEPFCIRIACAFTVLAHMLFVKVDEEARFNTQIFAHEPVGGGNHIACDEHCAAGQKAVEAENNMEDEVERCGSDEHFAEEQNEQRQMVSALFEPQLRKQVGIACAVDEHSTQNRCHDDEREHSGDNACIGQMQRVGEIWLQVHRRTNGNGQKQGAEYEHSDDINRKQILPVLVLAVFLVVIRVAVEPAQGTLRQDADELVIGRLCGHDAERRGEGRDNRNSNDNRIEEVAGDAEAHAKRGDDEGKFANLREAEAAVQRRVQALAGGEDAAGGEEELAANGHEHEYKDGHDILAQKRRIYEHTHGDEEDGAEEVLNRRNELFDALCFGSFGYERAHDEGAECRGEAELGSDNNHAEAETDGDNDEGFIVHELSGPFEKAGDEVHAQHEPEHEEEDETCHAHNQLHRADAAAGHGQRGEQHHHRDAGDVFHNQHAEDGFREVRRAQLEVIEGLDDDGRGRHGEHTA